MRAGLMGRAPSNGRRRGLKFVCATRAEHGIRQTVQVSPPGTITVLNVGTGRAEGWQIEDEVDAAHRGYRLTLVAPDSRSWTAFGPDIFECLLDLRRQVEPDGLRLCCNGSRPNAWSSGMQRDTGSGRVVFLLSKPRTRTRPPQVRTLDPAPSCEVVSVAEQLAWYSDWLGPQTNSDG